MSRPEQTKKDQRFAALPLRALRDARLSARHYRVLGIIAAHDQLDKNGAGCFASQRRLAALAGCGESRLSQTLTDLRDFGYLRSRKHPNPKKARLRIHRVIYDDQDKEWDRDTFPIGKVAAADTFPTGKGELSQSGKSEAISDSDKSLNSEVISANWKPLNICSEHIKKINSGEERTDCAEARRRPRIDPHKAEAYLADCEVHAAEGGTLRLERKLIAEIADDACLSEDVNERAAKLLARIPQPP